MTTLRKAILVYDDNAGNRARVEVSPVGAPALLESVGLDMDARMRVLGEAMRAQDSLFSPKVVPLGET